MSHVTNNIFVNSLKIAFIYKANSMQTYATSYNACIWRDVITHLNILIYILTHIRYFLTYISNNLKMYTSVYNLFFLGNSVHKFKLKTHFQI